MYKAYGEAIHRFIFIFHQKNLGLAANELVNPARLPGVGTVAGTGVGTVGGAGVNKGQSALSQCVNGMYDTVGGATAELPRRSPHATCTVQCQH